MSGNLFQSHCPFGVDLYRWIAPIYEPVVGPFLKPVRRRVSRLAGECGCRRILDVGCGTGEQAQFLASAGFSATGIDLSPAMLAKASERRPKGREGYPQPGETVFILGTAERLPFNSASFDCALISLVLHEMDYSAAVRAANETVRVLSPGGKLFIFDYLRPRRFTRWLSLSLLHVVERIAGGRHYANFRHFIRNGGLEGFVEQLPVRLISSSTFLGGATGLGVYQKEG